MIEERQKWRNESIPLDDKGFLLIGEVIAKVQTLMKEKQYNDAINYLNHIKNHAPLKSHLSIIKLHNLYIDLLIEIEDYPSLLNILNSKKKYLDNPKDKNMHLFYMAICYEGLGDDQMAIESLEKIEDILSSKNLANKYLKLAILYANTKQISLAKKALEHAKIFDREKNNDMFLLAESDILYQEKKYYKAIQLYETFFIKSKRKLSYLNRFIRISLALHRIDDAYDFYMRHKDQVIESNTIQSKIAFFESALEILKDINQEAYIEANQRLESYKNQPVIRFDDFEIYHFIISQTQDQKIYTNERDIIRDYFIDLDQMHAFKKMMVFKVNDAKIKMMHYSKKLLLEKDLEDNHSITHDILNQTNKHIYQRSDIQDFEFVGDEIECIFVEKINDDTYFLGYTSRDDYDLSRRLSLVSAGLLRQRLNHYSLVKTHQSLERGYLSLLESKGMGLIKIHHQHLILLNQQARDICQTEKDLISMKDFQEMISPMLYLDELTERVDQNIQINGQEYLMTTQLIDFDLYVLLDKTPEVQIDTWQPSSTQSIILIDVVNHYQLKNDWGYENYQTTFKTLVEALPKATNLHVMDMKIESNHQICILLNNRDKRIFERLDHKLKDERWQKFDIRYAYHHFNQSYEDTLNQLLKLLSMTTKDNHQLSGDQPLRKADEMEKLYLSTLKKWINDQSIQLRHSLIKNWESNQVTHIDIDFKDIGIINDHSYVRKVLKSNDLEILFDRLMVNQLIKDAQVYNHQTKFILPVSNASIESKKAFNYLLRRLKSIEKHQIIFKLQTSDYLLLSKSDQLYLLDKEISIALIGPILELNQIQQLDRLSILMIDSQVFNSDLSDEWMGMLKKRFDTIIYNHQDNQLLKKDLQRLGIYLVKGAFSGEKDIHI